MKYYTINEVAEITKLKPGTIRKAITQKRIIATKILTATRISQDELDRLVGKKGE